MSEIKEKVVVTGGAGFIGSHLVDALIEQGFETHIIDDLSGGKEENINNEATFHKINLIDYRQIAPILKGAKFVFHLAALPRVQFSIEHPREANEANVTATVNVLTASQEGGVERVIYSASSSAYGDQTTLPLVETMEAMPKSPYGLQKYIGELYCKAWSSVYNLPTVSLRYFNVYGPRLSAEGSYPLAIAVFLKQKKKGLPMTITGDGEQTRDFTHVRDVVKANLLASTSEKVGKGEVINIGAGKNFSINKVSEMVGGEIEYIAPRLEPKDTLADNSKAKDLLGWQPEVTLVEGIEELKELTGLQ